MATFQENWNVKGLVEKPKIKISWKDVEMKVENWSMKNQEIE